MIILRVRERSRRSAPIRNQIKASPDKTLLYAGKHFESAWVEIRDKKSRRDPYFVDKETLPEVLQRIPVTNQPFPNLRITSLAKVLPCDKNAFIAWRAVSGVFAAKC